MEQKIRKQLDLVSRSSLFVYANSAIVLPVSLVAITSELNFSLTQAGLLSLIGSFIQFPILLASIPIAASLGKIRLMRWGVWVLALGLLLFTRVADYPTTILIVAVIAVGQALIEALITPLVEDIHPGDDGSSQVFLHAFWPLGVIFGTLVVGEALSRGVSWRTVFLALGILCIGVGALYPRRSRVRLPRSRADFSHVKEILSEPVFWMMGAAMFLAGGAEGGFTYWTATYIQLEYGTLAREGGIGTAIFAMGMAIGRLLASRLMARLGLKRILITSVSLALAGGLCFYLVRNLILLYASMVLIGLSVAPFWPGIQTHTVRRVGADPTMVMVFLSCFGIIGFSSINLIMGIIGDAAGLRMSFLVAPTTLILLLILLVTESRLSAGEQFE